MTVVSANNTSLAEPNNGKLDEELNIFCPSPKMADISHTAITEHFPDYEIAKFHRIQNVPQVLEVLTNYKTSYHSTIITNS